MRAADTTLSVVDADLTFMDQALALAARGVRGVNPLVGAVAVGRDGAVLATGWHRGAGTSHAEADAIATAAREGTDLAGATMYVTLEPCNHTGRTGPCAQALIAAQVSRVVYAIDDPHAAASGGAETLRAAGIEVVKGVRSDEATELNRRWLGAVSSRRPFVTLHLAQTLDSRIAAEDGTSQWITCPQSLADNHATRSLIDAILVGSQTVAVDNPRLTARDTDGSLLAHQPLRAVMGLRDVPEGAAVRGTDGKFVHLRTQDPAEALETLFSLGVRHVMVEGGARIIAAFLGASLVDELIVYQAPTILGSGKNAVSDIGVHTLADAQHWDWDESDGGAVRRLGNDLRLHLFPAAAPATTLSSKEIH
ncbi:bifunctional diaminohydroxyphosphoribosylaminopyrimidine deaminase/5-amino-6-(5-phosphoribosylamino)uracil reductase RibD [Sinomonas sp. ASV486]|uniref:bifunctional diaminohydroxyphosphoribosylaminopyrimidine deaminase/5-amino-6-(5-phosphoribosylamino)uracil reductase RibD n=1 Tax=Sinomonas sp. ASV486 TaxID=3051170 RepID=UPI0027DB8654|nr:bifunctional diaminohydroxyphosphoribosylaminopyrimidine deaminase/5-amino-6-(5-phosphoribosylamino)uracil reductase RibD [Sinomonas sp. ASV486]MDQ4489643.1 bifunctional diaminohydroxyphosphoribosylaminopyrimidine deaminase/5-amino-6-(5-phosphoribosylamino)uracil reductase RibD [Sinomonas sp. ASV486]